MDIKDKKMLKWSALAGNVLFLYTHVTGCWSFQIYMLPKVYADSEESFRSFISWLLIFFCTESLVFWYFTLTTAKHDRVKGRFSSLEQIRVLKEEEAKKQAQADFTGISPHREGITTRNGWKTQEYDQQQSDALRNSVKNLTQQYLFKGEVNKLLEYTTKYLVWHDCKECGRVPPRSFHCNHCGTCVLKRDHHCFVTGVCIGHTNQRNFIVFNLYTAAATFLHYYTAVCYFCLVWETAARESTATAGNDDDQPAVQHEGEWKWTKADFDFEPSSFSRLSLFLPVTFFQAFLQRNIPMYLFCVVSHCYLLAYVGLMTTLFTVAEISLVLSGCTLHEMRFMLNLRVNEPIGSRIRSVFGPWWFLNFFFPTHAFCKQPADGTQWPTLTVKLNRARDVQAEVLNGVTTDGPQKVANSNDNQAACTGCSCHRNAKVHEI